MMTPLESCLKVLGSVEIIFAMLSRICRFLLYHLMGWKKEIVTQLPNKGIICLAPHTSNWDFVIGILFSRAEGFRSNFLMKREWFFWPLGPIFRHLGGIPVWRDRHSSLTDKLAETALKANQFMICVTPEGTRSLNPDWKKGFYFIALKANLPIILYALDYEKKLIVSTKVIVPTGNVDKDMREIKLYFKDFKGKNPDKFTVGEI